MKYQSVLDMVGKTPSVRVCINGAHCSGLFLKLEGFNPTGSIKDRACVFMLRSALENGELTAGKSVLDASSGNFACALAFYSRMLGYEATVAVGSKLTEAKRDFLKYLGATVHPVGDFTIEGNAFCRQLAAQSPEKYCFLDQLHNWRNPEAHYRTTGPEIMSEFPNATVIVGSLGSGGTMTGVGKYVKEKAPRV